MLLVKFFLIDQAHKSQALVDLAKIQDNFVVGAPSMVKFDDTRWFFVEFESASLFIDPVDAAYIDENINEFGADLIVLYLNRVTIGGNIDLGNYIKQESFFDLGVGDQVVYHSWDKANLRKKLLDDLR